MLLGEFRYAVWPSQNFASNLITQVFFFSGAVYADADVYLLDDPLSAVDASVSRSLFHRVLVEALASKTRLLVTHSLGYLKYCDQILVLKEGAISQSGSYDDLKAAQHGEFSDLNADFIMNVARNRARSASFGDDGERREARRLRVVSEPPSVAQVVDTPTEQPINSTQPLRNEHEASSLSTAADKTDETIANDQTIEATSVHPSASADSPRAAADGELSPLLTAAPATGPALVPPAAAAPAAAAQPRARLVEAEAMGAGRVNARVYGAYVRAIGGGVFALFLVIGIASAALGVKSNMWLAEVSARKTLSSKSAIASVERKLFLFSIAA